MAHFAKVDQGKVINVIVADQDFIDNLVDDIPGEYIKTSYNTRGGVHYSDDAKTIPSDDQSKALRKNYAGVGFTYDSDLDAFIPPKPFNSWILDENTCLWKAPMDMPEDGNQYKWNEEEGQWDINTRTE